MASEAASDTASVDRRAASPREPNPLSPRTITSEALLRGESQLAILHERTVYFLRRTRLGKLILTK
jgi:hemin uptake protein HemP